MEKSHENRIPLYVFLATEKLFQGVILHHNSKFPFMISPWENKVWQKKRNDSFAWKLREGYECLLAGSGGDRIVIFILKVILCEELLKNDDFEKLYELSAGIADEAPDPENEMTDSTRIEACSNHIIACLETGMNEGGREHAFFQSF